MQELEKQALREESKSHHDFLSTYQTALHHSPQPLNENLATSNHSLLGWSPLLPPPVQPTRAPLVEEQPPVAVPPTQLPKQSPWPKRQLPSPEPQGSMSKDGIAPKAMQEGPSSSKRHEAPAWFTSLKPSHAEAFLWDFSILKEARSCFFSNHSYDFINDGTHDLSDVFKELAKSASLLGEAMYKIQLSLTRPEELKQANYTLWSLPKGLRFLRVMPTSESPKVMGLMGIHNPDALWHYAGYTFCPWCGNEGKIEGTVVSHLRTTHYRLGLVCDRCFGCPSMMSDSLHQHGYQDCQQYSVPSGSGPSDWPNYPAKGSYKGVKAVLFNQASFLPESQKIWQRRCHLPTCLLFSWLADKTATLLRNNMTNNIKHTHPNWLQPRQCLQELIKATRSNNISSSWINGFNYTVYWNFLVSTTVTISSKYVCQLSAAIVKSGVFLRGPHIPPSLF